MGVTVVFVLFYGNDIQEMCYMKIGEKLDLWCCKLNNEEELDGVAL